MNGHKIICGSLAGGCTAGAIGMLVVEGDPVREVANRFFAGVGVLLALVFVWAGWWDEAADDNKAAAGRAERTAATGWLWLRRLACWGAACVAWLMAATLLADGLQPGQVPGFLMAVALGAMLIRAGLKGFGRKRGMGDDAAVHAERRKRYGWWF
jgi:hypothetical protein